MRGERPFWLAAVVTLITAIALFLPFYRDTTYIVPRFGTFVSWYRESALWPALTHNASSLSESILSCRCTSSRQLQDAFWPIGVSTK